MTRPIVITGGGTGGHIFPMLAIAEQLQALGVAKNEIRYVGSRRGQEKDLLSGDIRLTLLPHNRNSCRTSIKRLARISQCRARYEDKCHSKTFHFNSR